jgi:hypothetical protein
MQSGLKNAYESIKAFSETDFTEDLKKFDIPTLVLHGEDDQIVPVKILPESRHNSSTARRRSTTRERRMASLPHIRIRSTPLCSPSSRRRSSRSPTAKREGHSERRLKK